MNFSRRLLDARGVAAKLQCAKRTFDKKRAQLEKAGFPRPVLAADRFGTNRWDEGAIDAWLNLQMDPDLRDLAATRLPAAQDRELGDTLKQRAEALQF